MSCYRYAGDVTGHCLTCDTRRPLLLLTSDRPGDPPMAMCEECCEEFVYVPAGAPGYRYAGDGTARCPGCEAARRVLLLASRPGDPVLAMCEACEGEFVYAPRLISGVGLAAA